MSHVSPFVTSEAVSRKLSQFAPENLPSKNTNLLHPRNLMHRYPSKKEWASWKMYQDASTKMALVMFDKFSVSSPFFLGKLIIWVFFQQKQFFRNRSKPQRNGEPGGFVGPTVKGVPNSENTSQTHQVPWWDSMQQYYYENINTLMWLHPKNMCKARINSYERYDLRTVIYLDRRNLAPGMYKNPSIFLQ